MRMVESVWPALGAHIDGKACSRRPRCRAAAQFDADVAYLRGRRIQDPDRDE